jgi:hypothetical protein
MVSIKIREAGGDVITEYKSTLIKVKSAEPIFGSNIDWLEVLTTEGSKNGNQLRDFGTLPYGRYSVCYSFLSNKTPSDIFCTEVNAKPQLPPQLLSPENGATIAYLNPLLAWIPPMPDANQNYWYTIKLVERRDNQTCVQALQQNSPIVQERNYEGTNLATNDINGLGLENGKTYCWQVGAYTRQKLLANTDIWQFKVNNDKEPITDETDELPFYNVKEGLDGDNLPVKRLLKVAFDNRFNAATLKYVIYREDNNNKIVTDPPVVNLAQGVNQIALDCQAMKTLKPNIPHILEIQDENNAKYYCRFTYEKK